MDYKKLLFVVLMAANFCADAMTGKGRAIYYRAAIDGCYQALGAEAYEKLNMPVDRRSLIMVACDPVGKPVCLADMLGILSRSSDGYIAACAMPDDLVCIDQEYMETLPYGAKRFTIFHEIVHRILGDHVRMATLDAVAAQKAERKADKLAAQACCCQDCLVEQSTKSLGIPHEILDLLRMGSFDALPGCDADGNLSQLSLLDRLVKKYQGKFCAEHRRLRDERGISSPIVDQELYTSLRDRILPLAINMLQGVCKQPRFRRTYRRLLRLYRFLTPDLDDTKRNELILKSVQ